MIPTGRPISPITGSNWEGTGVTPDLDVPPERALAAAYKAALEHLLEGDKNRLALPEELLAEARGELAKLDDNAG